MECVFCKIIKNTDARKHLYEDENVIVFPDLHPVAPVHLLIIPKLHIEDFIKVTDKELFSMLLSVAQRMVAREGLKDRGFRITVNGGGAQLIRHLHFHLIGPIGKTAKL